MREAMSVGQGCKLELMHRSKYGRDYWVDIEVQPLRDASDALTGFVVIESDITARKTLQAQADEARQSLQDLYDNAPCAYYALDGQGRFLQINALGLTWLGCTAEELIGRMSVYAPYTSTSNGAAQTCQGDLNYNSFNGNGQVNALRALMD